MSLSTAADIAASLLLLGMFLVHAVVAVVLFLLWRLLRAAEGALHPASGVAAEHLDALRERVQAVTRSALAPQVQALSAWAAVRAGWSALVRPDRVP